jgi:hypothetical protein
MKAESVPQRSARRKRPVFVVAHEAEAKSWSVFGTPTPVRRWTRESLDRSTMLPGRGPVSRPAVSGCRG